MLDPDAQAFIDQFEPLLMPQPLHRMGVDAARAQVAALPAPPADPVVFAVDERSVPGPAGDVAVRVYRPSDEQGLPILVWLHGGAFVIGGPDMTDGLCRTLTNAAECIVVSVDYRLAPEHPFPAAFEDSYAALQWCAEHGAALGGDPARLAVGGDSAGAALAACVALHARDHGPTLALQAIVYGSSRYPSGEEDSMQRFVGPGQLLTAPDLEWSLDQYLQRPGDRGDVRANAWAAETLAGVAPAVVLTADHDPLLDDTTAYAERLKADGVPVTLRAYTGVFHGFLAFPGAIAKARTALADLAGDVRGAFSESSLLKAGAL